jgi:hypothetical protein
MIDNYAQYFWYVAITLLTINLLWFVSFGISKYVKAASCEKYRNHKKDNSYIYEFSYIWWFRNLLIRYPIINNKCRRTHPENGLKQTIYLPKTSHMLLSIGRISDSILGVKATKCKQNRYVYGWGRVGTNS